MKPTLRGLLLLISTLALPAAAQPLVVATIKPLALIARDVLGASAEVRQLLPDGASPHGYSLRPSERRLLAGADLILWVGPGLEAFLADALGGRPAGQVLTAATLPAIHWPPAGPGDGGDDGHAADLHLWLDPRNASAIADALVAALNARGDAVPAAAATAFAARMTQLETEIRARLAQAPDRTFAADHEAFGHFAARFGLTPVGHLRDAADHAAGARSVAALTARTDIRCLVAEPDSQPERMRHLAARLGARVQVVDALGAGIAAGAGGGYARLLTAVAEDFARCLGASPLP
jgi:zinc transport system substrate-binding protein